MTKKKAIKIPKISLNLKLKNGKILIKCDNFKINLINCKIFNINFSVRGCLTIGY